MALFKIFKGSSSDLGKVDTPTQKATEGFAYFTTDEGKFYIDISGDGTTDAVVGTNRIALNADRADRADNFNIAGTLNVVGNTSLHNQSAIDNATIGTLTVTGAANFVQSPTGPTPSAGDSSTKLATTAFVSAAITNNAYSLPLAASGTRGGIQIGYSESGTNYAIKLDNEKAYVTVPWTDRYVNNAAFAHDSTNNNVKMTLTRAGSDAQTVTANIPTVSSSSAGVAPKGAAVSAQSQTTKFLREDGAWAAPTYTTNFSHSITIGSQVYDGSADIVIPIYDGETVA